MVWYRFKILFRKTLRQKPVEVDNLLKSSDAYFDVPTVKTANKVRLGVDKHGSIIGALTADRLNHNLLFSSLVQLVSEENPLAVEVNTTMKLDIHLINRVPPISST